MYGPVSPRIPYGRQVIPDVGVELDDELVDRISTPWLPIERATTVGRTS